jgi:hypothetical protein
MKWFTFVFLILLFIITPFQKGLYFDHNIHLINLFIIVLFFGFYFLPIYQKRNSLFKMPMSIILLPLCFLLSLPFAVSPNNAWNSLLRWVFYSCFFILLIWTTSKPKIGQLLPVLFQLFGHYYLFQ